MQQPPLSQVVSSIRAADLMLAGSSMGYVGRPPYVPRYNPNESAPPPSFDVRYSAFAPPPLAEDALSCPVLPWPADPLSAPASFSACTDQACRDACEQLVLARKARRIYYPSDGCTNQDGDNPSAAVYGSCWYDYNHVTGSLPDATGPLLSLRVGCAESEVGTDGKVLTDPITKVVVEKACTELERDMVLTFVTQSGLNFAYRARPSSSSVAASFPTRATVYDRSVVRPLDGYRFYVSFPDGFVLDFSTAEGFNTGTVIY